MTQLTEHFSLEELTHSDTAVREGYDNDPDANAQISLRQLAIAILEPIRAAVGRAVIVTDAYRSPVVNAADGGVPGSAHQIGRAADIIVSGMELHDLFTLIQGLQLPDMDQCILESGCVHVAMSHTGVDARHEYLIRGGEAPNWTYTSA